MNDRIRIKSTKPLSEQWVNLTSVTLDYERSDGSWQTMVREIHDHGHAASILPYNPETGQVILVRQFRVPAHLNGDNGFMIEAIAGLLDDDEPAECVRREAMEEAGVKVGNPQYVMTFMASPGAITEKVHLFIAAYSGADRHSDGGGLHEEGEDIEVIELPFKTAFGMIASGEISDAKTIIALQHLALNTPF